MRAFSKPMLITGLGQPEQHCAALERLPLSAKTSDAAYTELWLQTLIQSHPTLLPVDQIEPALTPLVPVCMELPLRSGFADNLLLTPDGGIVLVEAKLWRNGGARREVVGQVLDYAKDLSRLSYEGLQVAVRIAVKDAKLDLFKLVCGDDVGPDDEASFCDAVSRNLRLGRFLLIIAGDGIQENAEDLADFLQRHVGLHFTLAMVEIALWRRPGADQVFVQPKIITRTVQIERAVVRMEEGVAMEASRLAAGPETARATNISEETFYEALQQVDPSLPERLKAYLHEIEPLGVFAEVKRNLSLKWPSPDGRTFQLGVIDLKGRLATDFIHPGTEAIGHMELSHAYDAELAAAVPDASIRHTPKPVGWRVVQGDHNIAVSALLNAKTEWIAAMSHFIEALRKVLASQEQD